MKRGTGRLDRMDGIRWAEQATNEAEWWARDVNGVKDAARLADFRAGHAQGWRDCLATLKLHGIVHSFDLPASIVRS